MKKLIISILISLTLMTAIPFASASAAVGPLDHVVLTPATATLATGATQQYTAVGQDAANQTVTGATFTWAVVAGGGTIDAAGLFTAGVTTGTFANTVQVTAVSGAITVTGTASVIVAAPGVLAQVVVSPSIVTLQYGATQQFTAQAKDAFSQLATGVTFTWAVVASGGTIDAAGLFTAGTTGGTFPGTVQVTATQGAISATATAKVTVVVPGALDHIVLTPDTATLATGATQQFTAVGKDALNGTVTGATFTWAVVAAGGTIDTAGLFTAGTTGGTFTGTVQVTAVQGAITQTATATVVVVVPGALDHVVLTPATATIANGATQQFTAVGKDALNGNVTGTTFAWAVVANGGTIDSAGLFTAGTTGGTFTDTVQVTATQGTITQTATATVVVVVPGTLDHVVVTPALVTLATGATRQFTAAAQDGLNGPVTGATFTWTVVTGGGTIDAAGLFTAGTTLGTFKDAVQVTAVLGNVSKTGKADVIVAQAGVLDHVVITPSEATVAPNATQQFTAEAQDAFNTAVTGATFTWAVVANGGTIDANGLFTAGATAGTFTDTVQVTAVLGDVTMTDTATVTVGTPGGGDEGGGEDTPVPPGWSHGNKTGWNGGDMPPGLAKKGDGMLPPGFSNGNKNGWNTPPAPPAPSASQGGNGHGNGRGK